jgi:Uma2 family endonuclease
MGAMPMSNVTISKPARVDTIYPDSDGQPMADNTLQFQWIVTIKEGMEEVFRHDPNVFVAGDLLLYPVEEKPKIRTAPDTLVAFGRPKGYRGSYIQFKEDGIAPQVVFEVLSPGNRPGKMTEKFRFYQKYEVEEFYIYDPDNNKLTGYQRNGAKLKAIPEMNGWVSPRLGVRFDLSGPVLKLFGPNGQPFRTVEELFQDRNQIAAKYDQVVGERDRLAAQLRALGIEPKMELLNSPRSDVNVRPVADRAR